MEIRTLLRALGGPTVVARKLGVSFNRVSNWPVRGIPPDYHIAIWALAVALDVGWKPPGAERLSLVLLEEKRASGRRAARVSFAA